MSRIASLGLVLLLASSLVAQVLPGAGKALKPADEIRGKFEDDKDLPKMKLAPANGAIADEAAFMKLWTAWKGDAAAPKIDFKKQIALVGTTQCAANRVFGSFAVSETGDVKVVFGTTLISGPGFAWVIYVVDREGIKSINGKPIP